MCKSWRFRNICREWRIWIRPLLIISYIMFAIIVVPILIVNSVKDGFGRKDQIILIGGLFVLSSVPISIWHIMQHIIHYTKPALQKHIIRILWMVPIYALNAWLGLIFPDHSIYVDSVRECYEAYVIYNFMVFLLNYLNLGMDLEAELEHKPQVKHFFPLCCIPPWPMGREFIHNCKHGILQYTLVRPLTTFIAFICEVTGVYGEGTFKLNVAFPYIIFINNLTQFVAMYCLVLFYQANKNDLKPMKPIPKFLCIKAVVFFSFFQGVVINFLVYFEYIKNIFGFDVGNDYAGLASLLQNFLICIEMFIAAIAHRYSFPHKPYHINVPQYWNNPNMNWFNAFIAMWDVTDVQEDVTEHLGVVGSTLIRPFRGNTHQYQPVPTGYNNESQYLIDSDSYQGSSTAIQTGNKNTFRNSANISYKNRYGAIDNQDEGATSLLGTRSQFGGINYSNNYKDDENKKLNYGAGAPKSNTYLQQRSDEFGSSSTNETTSSNSINITGNIKKSDSRSSDWLNTPTDDFMGIDVKGVERDKISYKNESKV